MKNKDKTGLTYFILNAATDSKIATADDCKVATLTGVTLTGFETVNLKADAVLDGSVTWTKSATGTSDSIVFTFDDKAIGNIGTAAAYAENKITLNGYTYDNASGHYVTGTSTTSHNYYTYNKGTGVVSYVA